MFALNPIKYEVVTAPTEEPVTGDTLAEWMGVSVTDPLLVALATSAREICEDHLNMAAITQTHRAWFDLPVASEQWWDGVRDGPINNIANVPEVLRIDKSPLQSVSSVTFYDDADASTVVSTSAYYVDTVSLWPSVALRSGYTWPAINNRVKNSIAIEFVSGYGADKESVPVSMQNGIKALAAFMYEHRGECDVQESLSRSGALDFWKPYRRLSA